jgi:hypothetical protein
MSATLVLFNLTLEGCECDMLFMGYQPLHSPNLTDVPGFKIVALFHASLFRRSAYACCARVCVDVVF